MKLSENLQKFMKNWELAKSENMTQHPIAHLLKEDIKTELEKLLIHNYPDLLVEASIGQGRWADIPWISMRNKSLATSMRKGIYPVLLFKSDGSGFYLSLNQGTEESSKIDIQNTINSILEKIPDIKIWGVKNMDLNASSSRGKSYEDANISAKYYSSDDMPNDSVLLADIEDLLKFYENIEQFEISKNLRIEITDMESYPLNQILYGPPGTGKTYETVAKAVAICDPKFKAESRKELKERYDELIENKQISFVTFHQSFSYEDFVEGIRATTDKEGNVQYSVEAGIFKQVCHHSSNSFYKLSHIIKNIRIHNVHHFNLVNEMKDDTEYTTTKKLWIVKIFDRNVYQKCILNSHLIMEDYFPERMEKGDLIIIADSDTTFKSICVVISESENLTPQIMDVEFICEWDISVSSQNIAFSKGFSHHKGNIIRCRHRRSELVYDQLLNNDIFFKNVSSVSINYNHVLIIDEINRGNIANIFGELITLLEPSKRAGNDDARSVILPYSKESFSVPNNLYVIGTMNTSDHSLTKLDLALRRRFEFVELLPDYQLLEDIEVYGVKIQEMLQIMNDRIEVLLGRDYLIGHSYFLPLKDAEDKEQALADIFKNKIIPLLQEYFFEDWERIQWVLNDQNKKDREHQFIHMAKDNNALKQLFGYSVDLHQMPDRRYQINSDAFNKSEAYRQILMPKDPSE